MLLTCAALAAGACGGGGASSDPSGIGGTNTTCTTSDPSCTDGVAGGGSGTTGSGSASGGTSSGGGSGTTAGGGTGGTSSGGTSGGTSSGGDTVTGACGALDSFADHATYSRERYVSTSGNDSTDGSQASPWRTLEFATRHAQPGDRVHVLAGTYACNTDLEVHGTAASPVAFVSEGAGAAVLDCGGDSEGFALHGASYVTIEGFEIRNTGGNGIHVDSGSSYIEIRDNQVHHTGPGGDCIKINQSNHVYLDANDVHDPGSTSGSAQGIDLVAVHTARVARNHIHDCANTDATFAKGASQDVVYDGNRIENIGGEGIILGGATDPQYFDPIGADYEGLRLVARNNVIVNATQAGIATRGCAQCAAVNNTIWESGARGQSLRVLGGGNSSDLRSRDVTFANNLLGYPSGDIRIPLQVTSGNGSGLRLSHNLWWNGGASIPSPDLEGVSMSIPEPDAVASADPRVVNAAGGDFHLASGSPATRAGANADAAWGMAGDADGVCRSTSAAPSIGASE